MAALFFPEALNQGHATFAQWLRGEMIILVGCLFVGFLGYSLTLVALGLTTAFIKRVPFRVMNNASMVVGVGSAALLELYSIPSRLHRASGLTAMIGISLALVFLALTVGIAVRLVWRSVLSSES